MPDIVKSMADDAALKIKMYQGLFEANAAVASSLDREEVLNIILEKAREMLNCKAGSIFLLNANTDELVLEASTNISREEAAQIRFPKGLGVAGWVAEHGEAVVLEDISKDPRFYPGVQEKLGFYTTSYLCVPLKVNDRIIGTAQVLNREDGKPFSEYDLHFMEGFAHQAAIALENARLHQEELEKKRIEEELALAYRIQQNLLPKQNPLLADYDIAGISYPSRWVGGDYYDFIPLTDDKLGIAIADVCGKGVPAAVLMSSVQAALHSLTTLNLSINEIIHNLNYYLVKNSGLDKFVTFFYGILDKSKHVFRYVNCGHNPPLFLKNSGGVILLKEGGMVLGVNEDEKFDTGEIELNTGNVILMFTDGVTEVHGIGGELFGEERLLESIKLLKYRNSREILQGIHDEVLDFSQSGQPDDDLTMICIKRI
ncbi:SpoIIE family protein phosphatase [bacterium]|nr:SpoIIE family protein phosphatase [bacterium]